MIVYAALGGSGPTAGIWRSMDTGQTWTLMRGGAATDVTLDPDSGTGTTTILGQTATAIGQPPGRLPRRRFGGDGVYSSPNQGQSWFQMVGGVGDPLIQDNVAGRPALTVADPVVTPRRTARYKPPTSPAGTNEAPDRPAPAAVRHRGDPVASEDLIYSGYLYVPVANGGNLSGLYVTKDFGQNWTKVPISNAPGSPTRHGPRSTPSNNVTGPCPTTTSIDGDGGV